MPRSTEHLTWVIDHMPEASALALAKFTEINPHWRGANWDDCLDIILDTDSDLQWTEPMFDLMTDPADGMYRLVAAVTMTMIYAHREFGELDAVDRLNVVENIIHVQNATYRIERCFADDRPREVIDTGLSLAEAQAHCNDPSTHGDGWFDAYYKEDE